MKKRSKKGFVVSAILYPLLVLFLALIMGMLSMTDTRKRILDRMKLEINEDMFNSDTCSCDTILNKLNYLIKNGVGGGASGSYTFNVLGLNVKAYPTTADMPRTNNAIGDIAIISELEVVDYYVATTPPKDPKNGSVWVVQDINSPYYVESDYSKIGINYCMQYENGTWYLKETYVFTSDGKWTRLYFVDLDGTKVNLNGTNINATAQWTYDYTGKYQIFEPVFSGYYKIELWGASGGYYSANTGGLGAYTSGEIYLDNSDTLYIYVGGQGTNPGSYQSLGGDGWNGGGKGYRNNTSYSYGGGGGGGATDVRLKKAGVTATEWNIFDSLASRIMVAAGGSGSANWNGTNSDGVAGGGIYGYMGLSASNAASSLSAGIGRAASQSGPGDNPASPLTAGGFGYGGNAGVRNGSYSNSAGGGGYYGGGGSYGFEGNYGYTVSGGSGSSYISGYNGCNSIAEESVANNIVMTGSAYHYSGYYFKKGRMIDGNGYLWNEAMPVSLIKQPTHDGKSIQVGNSGNGYAKITIMTVEYQKREKLEETAKENETYWSYGYSGEQQRFTAPYSGYYTFQLWGAQGGGAGGIDGGLGSYTAGDIYLKKNETFYLYVGGEGWNSASYSTPQGGGWNGGGNGVRNNSSYSYYASGGGGATDVRTITGTSNSDWSSFNSLKSRIMVAAGGGGAVNWNGSNSLGASGGGYRGYTGYTGSSYSKLGAPGGGASQAAAGPISGGSTNNDHSVTKGGFGFAGRGATGSYSNGGGGSGYYGGSGAGDDTSGMAGGGSGSCFISGALGFDAIADSSVANSISFSGSAFHPNGNYFINTKVIDGYGYEWKEGTKINNKINQPTYDNVLTKTGNNGDGYAIIKLKEKVSKTQDEINAVKEEKELYWNFAYNGTYHTFTVPKTGQYKIELWGAQGGTTYYNTNEGGRGSYTVGKISLNKGTRLYVYVGGSGESPRIYNIVAGGGWNGGGNAMKQNTSYGHFAGGGGGSTDIRTVATSALNTWDEISSLKTRIMVAAGGSGSAYWNGSSRSGIDGGGINGSAGAGHASGVTVAGGSQIAGGTVKKNSTIYSNLAGGFGYGGYVNTSCTAGGGGSGWYGGGGVPECNSGYDVGGSGSSYISGLSGCIAVNSSGNPLVNSYSTLADSISYLNYSFIDAKIIDGSGYQWTSGTRGTLINQPSYDGVTLQTGNRGDGFAKITYLGATS